MSKEQMNNDEDIQAMDQRGQQDLECLALLKEAFELRKESEYIDGMFDALKNDGAVLDPAIQEYLKQLDD